MELYRWRIRLSEFLGYGLGVLITLTGILVTLGVFFLLAWLVYAIAS